MREISCLEDLIGVLRSMIKDASESAKYWLGVRNEFKNRGVNKELIFTEDGLNRYPEASRAVYPPAEIQCCSFTRSKIRWRRWPGRTARRLPAPCARSTPLQQSKPVSWHWPNSRTPGGAVVPCVVLPRKRHWTKLAIFFHYPEAVRRLMYATNPTESLNSRVRKTVKGKSAFPTETALFKALYLAIAEAEKRRTMRTRNWHEIMAQLSIFFQERLPYPSPLHRI